MFEYTKMILQKVSFDKDLFKKELAKSFRWLRYEEVMMLELWVTATFSIMYGDVISEVFSQVV